MKKRVKLKHVKVMLIMFIAALILLLIFSFYLAMEKEEIGQEVDEEKYTVEEIIEPEDAIPEETAEIPLIEETEKEVEILNKVEIKIYNGRFYPKEIIISPGTAVTWTNTDQWPHKIVAYDRLFYGTRMGPGDSYTFTFTNEGTHTYFDAIFPKTGKGKITVKEEPLPITGGVVGIDLAKEENNAKFALLFVLFIIMVFGLSHGIYKHHNK